MSTYLDKNMNNSLQSLSWSFPYCPSQNRKEIDWLALETQFDWLRSLADCPQDARYHAEGNVLIHTKLVCEELVALPQWQTLPEKERSILFAAALLHDVAKPGATQIEEDGAITSIGHARQGAKMARQILWDLNVPLQAREAIVALVKYSSLPLWFWDKPNPQRAVIKASQIVRCDWLGLLAVADVRGRYCNDREQLLERIEFWNEFCQENNCFDQSFPFSNAHSRFIYFQKEDANPNYVAYDNTRCSVVMMSGLPGSGKDTWIKENLADWQVISLDRLRRTMGIDPDEEQGAVAQKAKEQAKEYLRAGLSFVWNATNLSRQLREMLIRLFSSYQANIRIVYLESPKEELKKRNRTRQTQVPEKVLDRMINRTEVPDITEAHAVDWIVQ